MELVSWSNLVHVTNLTRPLNLLALARIYEGESGSQPLASAVEVQMELCRSAAFLWGNTSLWGYDNVAVGSSA